METSIRTIKAAGKETWLRLKSLASLGKLSKNNPRDYQKYLSDQVRKTITKIDKDPTFRYTQLVEELLKVYEGAKSSVLCVGCRNHYELDAFERAGFEKVTGIDLVSADVRIMVMDMHDMKFADNSFDVVYSADSLEHAFDIKKAAKEFCRVVRNNGYLVIQMPINIPQVNDIDRWDIKDLNHLLELFQQNAKNVTVKWSAVEPRKLSAIFSIQK